MENFVNLTSLGYTLIAASYLGGGLRNIFNWEHNITYLRSKNVPFPNIVLMLGIALQSVGGVLILLPTMRHVGLAILLVFTVVMMLIFFRFWTMRGLERHVNVLLFLDNIALLGGLLLALALAPKI